MKKKNRIKYQIIGDGEISFNWNGVPHLILIQPKVKNPKSPKLKLIAVRNSKRHYRSGLFRIEDDGLLYSFDILSEKKKEYWHLRVFPELQELEFEKQDDFDDPFSMAAA